jgi:hypothetical protein
MILIQLSCIRNVTSTGLLKQASAEIELPDAILNIWAKFKEVIFYGMIK